METIYDRFKLEQNLKNRVQTDLNPIFIKVDEQQSENDPIQVSDDSDDDDPPAEERPANSTNENERNEDDSGDAQTQAVDLNAITTIQMNNENGYILEHDSGDEISGENNANAVQIEIVSASPGILESDHVQTPNDDIFFEVTEDRDAMETQDVSQIPFENVDGQNANSLSQGFTMSHATNGENMTEAQSNSAHSRIAIRSSSRNRRSVRFLSEEHEACSSCVNSTSLKSQKKTRKVSAEPVKGVECEVENCNYVGKTNWHLKRHMKTHNRAYQCIYCPKSFHLMTQSVQHRKTHSGEQPYLCNYCPDKFKKFSQLQAHAKVHMIVN